MAIAQTALPRLSIGVIPGIETLSDEELLALSQEKPSAFEFLVSRYQTQFLSRAQMVVKSRDAAEDVVQDAFVRMYRFAPRFDADQGNFRSWALTILMNVARTHYSRAARERGYTAPLTPEHYESLADDSVENKEGPEGYARETVQKVLAKAPKEVAEILSLAFLDGLPHAEIGERLGISAAAVKTRVHRAKAVMREIMSNDPTL